MTSGHHYTCQAMNDEPHVEAIEYIVVSVAGIISSRLAHPTLSSHMTLPCWATATAIEGIDSSTSGSHRQGLRRTCTAKSTKWPPQPIRSRLRATRHAWRTTTTRPRRISPRPLPARRSSPNAPRQQTPPVHTAELRPVLSTSEPARRSYRAPCQDAPS